MRPPSPKARATEAAVVDVHTRSAEHAILICDVERRTTPVLAVTSPLEAAHAEPCSRRSLRAHVDDLLDTLRERLTNEQGVVAALAKTDIAVASADDRAPTRRGWSSVEDVPAASMRHSNRTERVAYAGLLHELVTGSVRPPGWRLGS